MFRYVKFIVDAKKGIEKPDELATDLSFGFVEGFFLLGIITSAVLAIAAGYFGFRFDLVFLKFIMVLAGLFFLFFLGIMIVLKRIIGNISKKATTTMRQKITNRQVVDVQPKNK
jgi:ABC-type dipeptide/oligopeptide/nickel transport system permease subunit